MQSRAIGFYIFHGMRHRWLLQATEGYVVKQPEGEKKFGGVEFHIKKMMEELDEYGLVVTRRAADFALGDILQELEKGALNDPLTAQQATRLTEGMESVYKTLEAEAAGHISFIVTDKRYPVSRLLEDISPLFANGVFDKLPAVAKYDFQEAGKCIAFELQTAAAFHLMRATEDVLRLLYKRKFKSKKDRISEPLMWGPMMTHLNKLKNPLPAELVHELDGLREHFRNPTQHPEKIYDADEAQGLLERSIDVINRMVKLMP